MTNNVALNVAIGIVFIFLLYSLLATTIKESIASLLGLRARMLKKGIVTGMLSDTPDDNRWLSLVKGIWSYIAEVWYFIRGTSSSKTKTMTLGEKFYEHPLIKNYGSNRIYPTPSYLPADNFSAVMLEILLNDFNAKISEIADFVSKQSAGVTNAKDISLNLLSTQDANKIKELLDFYHAFYTVADDLKIPDAIIDSDTVKILQMKLKESVYDLQTFSKKLEDWFNDSMDRVSGWYKRQVQVILFIIGVVIGIIFNVDVIEIGGKLSKDKDARDTMVQLAVQASDKYKDDPRIKKPASGGDGNLVPADSANNKQVFEEYKTNIDSAKNLVDQDIKNANQVLAIGWSDYGKKADSAALLNTFSGEVADIKMNIKKNPAFLKSGDTTPAAMNRIALDSLFDKHPVRIKVGYVLKESARGRKFLGFLILGFAVCLGAPFWFDLLSKFINLRGSGTKEGAPDKNKKEIKTQPITLNVNTKSTTEEAVG
jgi:hypothetical protein